MGLYRAGDGGPRAFQGCFVFQVGQSSATFFIGLTANWLTHFETRNKPEELLKRLLFSPEKGYARGKVHHIPGRTPRLANPVASMAIVCAYQFVLRPQEGQSGPDCFDAVRDEIADWICEIYRV